MRSIPLRNQLIAVLLILIISYLLFTLFPSIFPHPEDFSPYAYVVAFLAGIEMLFLIKDGKRRWLLLPILFVCLLALLDETGYGSEVMNIKPFYSQTLHTEIRDLHNLIGIVVELSARALKDWHWNGGLFAQFLAVDGFLLLTGFLVGWFLRFRKPDSEQALRIRLQWLVSALWFASGLTVAIYLLSLPQDPKNAFLFGHSAARLLSIVVTFIISTVPLVLLIYQRNAPQGFLRSITDWLSKNSRVLLVLSIVLVFVSLTYQFYAPFIFLPDQQINLERITPLAVWLLAVNWFATLDLVALRGGFRKPLSDLFVRWANFLRREPAYFYMISAVTLILIAQLIDRGFIPLNTLIPTPNFHVKLWGLWTEETLEMNGAFLFTVAAFYFPKTK